MWLSQPSPIEKQCCVDTLDGDERGQPEDQSTRRQEDVIHYFAENIIDRGCSSAAVGGSEIVNDV